MADESKYFKDIPLNLGPYDTTADTLVIVRDSDKKEYRVPLKHVDLGRNVTFALPIDNDGHIHVDYAISDYFSLLLTRNVDSWSFESMPEGVTAATLAFFIKQDATGGRTVAWPATFRWSGGAPLIPEEADSVHLLIITTFDEGVTWLADFARNYAP